jgi:hypothetical protein
LIGPQGTWRIAQAASQTSRVRVANAVASRCTSSARVRNTRSVGRKARIGREFIEARNVTETTELRVIADRQHEVPVGRGNAWYGAMFGCAVPRRPGARPVTR